MHSPSGMPQLNGEDGGVNCMRCSTLFTRNVLCFLFFPLNRARIKNKNKFLKRKHLRGCVDMPSTRMQTGCSARALRWLDPGQQSATASSEGRHRRAQAVLPGWLCAQVEWHQPGAPGCVDMPGVFSCHSGFFSSQLFAPGTLSDFLRTRSRCCSDCVLGTFVTLRLSSSAPGSAGTRSCIHACHSFVPQ